MGAFWSPNPDGSKTTGKKAVKRKEIRGPLQVGAPGAPLQSNGWYRQEWALPTIEIRAHDYLHSFFALSPLVWWPVWFESVRSTLNRAITQGQCRTLAFLENGPHGPAEVLDINNASFTHFDVSETDTLMIIPWVSSTRTKRRQFLILSGLPEGPGLSQPPYV